MTTKQRRGWTVALTATALPVALATLPPLLEPAGRALIMEAFALVCHQIPERSPHLHGVALAVCDRCYGIYWGFFAGVALWGALWGWDGRRAERLDVRLERDARYLVLLALVPLGLDWLVDAIGLWANTPPSRWLTGGFFGLVAGVLLARALLRVRPPQRTSPVEPQGG